MQSLLKRSVQFVLLATAFNLAPALTFGAECVLKGAQNQEGTQAIETCLRSNPSGDVVIPAGTFEITRPLIKNRNQNLLGSGSKATILKCEMRYGPCIIAADTANGPNNYNFSEIQNLTLLGPGSSSESSGVLLGGDPSGKLISNNAYGDEVNFTDVRITGFMRGIEWGNHAWANKLFHAAIFGNAIGLYVPPALQESGEAISITDSNLFNNSDAAIDDHGNFEWMIQGTSFDYNNIAIRFLGSNLHIVNCHFEQPRAQLFFQPYGRAVLSVRDSMILVQNTSGAEKFILDVWPQSLVLTIDDVGIWSNHAVAYFMHVQGSIAGTISNLHGNTNAKIGKLSDGEVHISTTTSLPFAP